MAFPILIYNASTGSDTAASGAGPATAITGSGAAHTNGGASTTITLTNSPDLSGVATDGSAAIFLNTSAGSRHLSKITAVDDGADTVTAEDSFNIGSGSAVDYAIGGKRAFWEADTTNTDWDDSKSGWKHECNDGTYPITVTVNPQAGDDIDGPIVFQSTNPKGAILDIQTDINHFGIATSFSYVHVLDFKFTRSVGSSNLSFAYRTDIQSKVRFAGNEVDGTGMRAGVFFNTTTTYEIEDNEFYGFDQTTPAAFIPQAGRPRGSFTRNSVHDFSGGAILAGSGSSFSSLTAHENTLYSINYGIDIDLNVDTDAYVFDMRNNTLFDISGDGLSLFDATADPDSIVIIEGNIFDSIVGTAVNASAQTGVGTVIHNDHNCMNNNGTNYNNVTPGPNDVNADPLFVSTTPGSQDFNLQSGSPCNAAMPSGPSS